MTYASFFLLAIHSLFGPVDLARRQSYWLIGLENLWFSGD